jgi:hypothetical protein
VPNAGDSLFTSCAGKTTNKKLVMFSLLIFMCVTLYLIGFTIDIYECPAYYYAVRAGNQKFASYVLTVNLQRGIQSAEFWVKRGTALLLNLSD